MRRQVLDDWPFTEALQAGRIGLWRATLGFEPSRGFAFSTYVCLALYPAQGVARRRGPHPTLCFIRDAEAAASLPTSAGAYCLENPIGTWLIFSPVPLPVTRNLTPGPNHV